jgi:hypothetical protein
LLGELNAEVSRKDIFQTQMRMKSVHEISNENGVTIVNSDTSKI